MEEPQAKTEEVDFASAPELSEPKVPSSELTQALDSTEGLDGRAGEAARATQELQKQDLTSLQQQQQSLEEIVSAANLAGPDQKEEDLAALIPQDFVLNDDSKDEAGSHDAEEKREPKKRQQPQQPLHPSTNEEQPVLADAPVDEAEQPSVPLVESQEQADKFQAKEDEEEQNDNHTLQPKDDDLQEKKEEVDFKEGSEPSQSYSQQYSAPTEPAKNSGFIPAESDFNKHHGLTSSQQFAKPLTGIQTEPSSLLTSVIQKHPPSGYPAETASRDGSHLSASNSQPGQPQPLEMFGKPPPATTPDEKSFQSEPILEENQPSNNQTFGAHTQPGQFAMLAPAPSTPPPEQLAQQEPSLFSNFGQVHQRAAGYFGQAQGPISTAPPMTMVQRNSPGRSRSGSQSPPPQGQPGPNAHAPQVNLSNMNTHGAQLSASSNLQPPVHQGQQFSNQPPQQSTQSPSQNNSNRLPHYFHQQLENHFQAQQQFARDQQFRELMFGEILQTNKQLLQNVQETGRQALQSVQMVAGMVAPLLETKDRDNRKLKRLLSQRFCKTMEEDIQEAELRIKEKFKVRFPKRQRVHEDSDEGGVSPSRYLGGETDYNASIEASRPSEFEPRTAASRNLQQSALGDRSGALAEEKEPATEAQEEVPALRGDNAIQAEAFMKKLEREEEANDFPDLFQVDKQIPGTGAEVLKEQEASVFRKSDQSTPARPLFPKVLTESGFMTNTEMPGSSARFSPQKFPGSSSRFSPSKDIVAASASVTQVEHENPDEITLDLKVDKKMIQAIAGLSTQDSLLSDDEDDLDEAELKRRAQETSASIKQISAGIEALQNGINQMEFLNRQVAHLQPALSTLEDRKRKFFSQFEKTITVETTDPLLFAICNIDRYGGLEQENQIEVVSMDLEQELMKAKLRRDYPNMDSGFRQPRSRFDIQCVQKARFWKSTCLCVLAAHDIKAENQLVEKLKIECKICEGKGRVGAEQLHRILKDNLGSRVTSAEFDKYWTDNMYAQTIWKLACYNQFFKAESLTLFNILHNLAQKLMKEFLELKKSFFQKVIVNEIPAGTHCVLLVTNVRKSLNKGNQKSYLIDVSDGSYTMTIFVNEHEKRFNCDKHLLGLIENNQLKVGEKYHFFGIFLSRSEMFDRDKIPRLNSEHYFLQNKHQYYLKININGFQRAHNSEKLGEQPFPFFRYSVNQINQYSKQICCTDVFVIKKTTQYFLEEFEVTDVHEAAKRSKRILRSRKTMERIRYLREEALQGKLNKDFENILFKHQTRKDQNEIQFQIDTDTLREQADELRRKKLDCFKLCFRIKVADAIHYEKIKQKEEEWLSSRDPEKDPESYRDTAEFKEEIERINSEIVLGRTIIISFIKASEEMFEDIQVGHRFRFYNLKPDGTVNMQGSKIKNDQCLFLQFQYGKSKYESVAEKLKERFGGFVPAKTKAVIQDLKEFGDCLRLQPIKPKDYLKHIISICPLKDHEEITNYKKCNEMTFVGYIVKIFYQPNPEGPSHPDSVNQFIVLSSDGDIICVQIHDANFFIKNAFPSENQRVVLDHIAFTQMSRVHIKTRNNDLIDDRALQEVLPEYHKSVACTDCLGKEEDQMPDHFYYLMASTNNATEIETESKTRVRLKDDSQVMSAFIDSPRFRLRIRQVEMIVGERKSIEKSSSEAASPVKEEVKRPTFFMQGYNCLNPSELGQPPSKDMVITQGGIQSKGNSPVKKVGGTSMTYQFRSKHLKSGATCQLTDIIDKSKGTAIARQPYVRGTMKGSSLMDSIKRQQGKQTPSTSPVQPPRSDSPAKPQLLWSMSQAEKASPEKSEPKVDTEMEEVAEENSTKPERSAQKQESEVDSEEVDEIDSSEDISVPTPMKEDELVYGSEFSTPEKQKLPAGTEAVTQAAGDESLKPSLSATNKEEAKLETNEANKAELKDTVIGPFPPFEDSDVEDIPETNPVPSASEVESEVFTSNMRSTPRSKKTTPAKEGKGSTRKRITPSKGGTASPSPKKRYAAKRQIDSPTLSPLKKAHSPGEPCEPNKPPTEPKKEQPDKEQSEVEEPQPTEQTEPTEPTMSILDLLDAYHK